MIVAEFRIDHAAAVVDHHFLIQRGAERLRDAALDLAAALHGIGDPAGIRGVHALEDLDLAGALVHGDPKALDVEGDRTRRACRVAVCAQAFVPARARLRRVRRTTNVACRRPTESFSSTHASATVSSSRVEAKTLMSSARFSAATWVAQSGDKGAGAAIGAGIVAAMGGVGLHQADLIDGGRERGRGDLAMHRRGAVAEFRGADGELEAAVVAQRNLGSRRCVRPAARYRSW